MLSLLLPKPEVTTQGDMAWGTLTAGARQLPLLRCSGGGCFLQGFCIRRRLADGRIKRRQGFCPMRADRVGGTPLSSVAPSKATGWPVARRCSSRSCWQGPPAWAQTTALPAHKFSCCLNNGGSRCGEGGCQRAPKKGAPPLHWVNKSFAPWLAVGPGSWGSVPARRGQRAGSCPALPKQCSSMQGLASAFMIYFKFKSMPRPSGRGEGCQELGQCRGGRKEAGLPLCASLGHAPHRGILLGSCSQLGCAGGDSRLGWVSTPEAGVWCLMFAEWLRMERQPC